MGNQPDLTYPSIMKTKHTQTGNTASVILTTLLLAMALPCAASSILYDSTAGGTSLGDSNDILNGVCGVDYIEGAAYQGTSNALLGQISFGLAIGDGAYAGGTFTLSIYEFSGSNPVNGQSPVYTQDFTAALQTGTTSMFPVTLDTPYEITANQMFGIALSHTATSQGPWMKWTRATAIDTASPLSLSSYGFYSVDSGETFGAFGIGNGRAITLSGDISAVPETSTSLGLLALGAGGLLTRRRFILKA
jgi:hypothetical protein